MVTRVIINRRKIAILIDHFWIHKGIFQVFSWKLYFQISRYYDNLLYTYEELVSKTSYIHPDMLLICIIDFLLQLDSSSLIKYVPIVGYFHCDVLHNVYKVIKSGNEWHAGVDRRGFGIKQDFFPLFFFMYSMFKIYDRVTKQFLQL